jgi:hypothetical protein
MLNKVRRGQKIDEYRRDERQRQQDSRARRKVLREDTDFSTPPRDMSRTGLSVKLLEIIENFLIFSDSDPDLSRTTLRAAQEEISRILQVIEERSPQELRQGGAENGGCHGPP